MKKAELMAIHGWGFNAACWESWQAYIPEEVSFLTFDRGYFGSSREPGFSEGDHSKIVLAHSFGLHLCNRRIMNQAGMLVIFGGFLSFHPGAAQFRRRSQLVLNQMISRFRREPRQVLEAFYQNVFYPQQGWDAPEGYLNEALLLNDLNDLNEHAMEVKRLNNIPRICILHGFRDSIVSRAKGRELYDELQPGAKYLEVKNAGHALPFTHTEQCWSFLKPEIEALI